MYLATFVSLYRPRITRDPVPDLPYTPSSSSSKVSPTCSYYRITRKFDHAKRNAPSSREGAQNICFVGQMNLLRAVVLALWLWTAASQNSTTSVPTTRTTLEPTTHETTFVPSESSGNENGLILIETKRRPYLDLFPPINVTAVAVSPFSVRVTWDLPLNRPSDDFLEGYNVMYYSLDDIFSRGSVILANGSTLQTTIENLKPFRRYAVSVAIKVTGLGNLEWSNFSRSVIVRTKPSSTWRPIFPCIDDTFFARSFNACS